MLYLQLKSKLLITSFKSNLFVKKLEKKEKVFLDYFAKFQWLDNNDGSYFGYSPLMPTHNNALERFNQQIKDQQKWQCRTPVNKFLRDLQSRIVKEWSEDRNPNHKLSFKKFETRPKCLISLSISM